MPFTGKACELKRISRKINNKETLIYFKTFITSVKFPIPEYAQVFVQLSSYDDTDILAGQTNLKQDD